MPTVRSCEERQQLLAEQAESRRTIREFCRDRAGGPWGQGFPAPLFVGDFTVTGVRLLSEGLHAKLTLTGADGGILEAIAFQCQARLGWCPASGPVRLVYSLALNRYQGRESVQLVVERVFPIAHASAPQ